MGVIATVLTTTHKPHVRSVYCGLSMIVTSLNTGLHDVRFANECQVARKGPDRMMRHARDCDDRSPQPVQGSCARLCWRFGVQYGRSTDSQFASRNCGYFWIATPRRVFRLESRNLENLPFSD